MIGFSIVVSDTSPVRALHHLGRLSLLTELYERILIPPSVHEELLRPRKRFEPIDLAAILPSSAIVAPQDNQLVQRLADEIQRGEAEAIVLADQLHALLLIDEAAGRAIAFRMGVRFTGVVGILVEAKSRGLIPEVIPLLVQLRNNLGFFLSPKLLNDIKRDMAE